MSKCHFLCPKQTVDTGIRLVGFSRTEGAVVSCVVDYYYLERLGYLWLCQDGRQEARVCLTSVPSSKALFVWDDNPRWLISYLIHDISSHSSLGSTFKLCHTCLAFMLRAAP